MLRAVILMMGLATGVQAEGFVDRFDRIDPKQWHVANYDFSHPSFDTDWRPGQAIASNGLELRLSPHDGLNQYAGASVRTNETYHYGQYSVRMKAAKGDGVVTGFFTYTGPHYGTQHDEIDIEILGKDTTKLHVAWFVDGELTNHFIQLGFDAAAGFHDYTFDWQPNGMTWFVDGRQVFQHSAADGPIPRLAGHLFANIWAADPKIAIWSGLTPTKHNRQSFCSVCPFYAN